MLEFCSLLLFCILEFQQERQAIKMAQCSMGEGRISVQVGNERLKVLVAVRDQKESGCHAVVGIKGSGRSLVPIL